MPNGHRSERILTHQKINLKNKIHLKIMFEQKKCLRRCYTRHRPNGMRLSHKSMKKKTEANTKIVVYFKYQKNLKNNF